MKHQNKLVKNLYPKLGFKRLDKKYLLNTFMGKKLKTKNKNIQ